MIFSGRPLYSTLSYQMYVLCVINWPFWTILSGIFLFFVGTFPIDTTKTRLQIQGQTIDARHTQLKYRGMLHAAFKIGSEEGICALYSGWVKYTINNYLNEIYFALPYNRRTMNFWEEILPDLTDDVFVLKLMILGKYRNEGPVIVS